MAFIFQESIWTYPLPTNTEAGFLQIDTEGIYRNSAIRAVSILRRETGTWYLWQGFAETADDEEALLQNALSLLDRNSFVVYAEAFTVRMLEERMRRYGLCAPQIHWSDIKNSIRHRKTLLPIKSTAKEHILRLFHENPLSLDGADISNILQSPTNSEVKNTIFSYQVQALAQLVSLHAKLQQLQNSLSFPLILQGQNLRAEIREISQKKEQILLSCHLNHAIYLPFHTYRGHLECHAEEHGLSLLSACQEGKFFEHRVVGVPLEYPLKNHSAYLLPRPFYPLLADSQGITANIYTFCRSYVRSLLQERQ